MTGYPTDRRKANLRLAELAICDRLQLRNLGAAHPPVPDCGAGEDQVCQLEISVPMPASDEHQEPYIAGAIALAAYSKVCALFNPGGEWQCEVRRGNDAIFAGLNTALAFTGATIPGLLDLKLDDAYNLGLEEVVLAASSRGVYEQTKFYGDLSDVLAWQHTPPAVQFCDSLACLIAKYIG
jgi:hypothetical protein